MLSYSKPLVPTTTTRRRRCLENARFTEDPIPDVTIRPRLCYGEFFPPLWSKHIVAFRARIYGDAQPTKEKTSCCDASCAEAVENARHPRDSSCLCVEVTLVSGVNLLLSVVVVWLFSHLNRNKFDPPLEVLADGERFVGFTTSNQHGVAWKSTEKMLFKLYTTIVPRRMRLSLRTQSRWSSKVQRVDSPQEHRSRKRSRSPRPGPS